MNASFGADLELAEASVVPGVRAFHDPADAGLQRGALLADHVAAAQPVQQVAGLS